MVSSSNPFPHCYWRISSRRAQVPLECRGCKRYGEICKAAAKTTSHPNCFKRVRVVYTDVYTPSTGGAISWKDWAQPFTTTDPRSKPTSIFCRPA